MIDRREKEFTDEFTEKIPYSRREKVENMLETLCRWRKKGKPLLISQICQHFGLSRRDLTYYIKKMVEYGYLHAPSGADELKLTAFGIAQGEESCYRHDSLAQFLQLVGVEKEAAEQDACRMEHLVGAKTIEKICDFMNYGITYERVIDNINLRCKYEPGTYEFLMGIYRMEQRYPRILAEEFSAYEENIVLDVRQERSYFCLRRQEGEMLKSLWYQDADIGWVKARQEGLEEWIPTEVFQFTISPKDPVMEGVALIAFVEGTDLSAEKNCRELNVHIW